MNELPSEEPSDTDLEAVRDLLFGGTQEEVPKSRLMHDQVVFELDEEDNSLEQKLNKLEARLDSFEDKVIGELAESNQRQTAEMEMLREEVLKVLASKNHSEAERAQLSKFLIDLGNKINPSGSTQN